MTTYTSTNAHRYCASCGQTRVCLRSCLDRRHLSPSVPIIPGPDPLLPPGQVFVYEDGQMRLEDSYVISQAIPPSPAAQTRVDIGGLTMTGVMTALRKGPQTHVKPRKRVPGWSVLAVFLGSVLAALGLVFNDPVVRALWEVVGR